MKVILNDLTIIMSGTSDEIKKIKKFVTYKDTKNCFFGGKYHPERERDICLGKEVKGYFVCFAGLAKEIFIFARDNKIKIEEFKDNRTHFDFQKKEWTHDELRKFFNPNFKYVEHQIRALQAMLNTNTGLCVLPTSAGKSSIFSAFIRLSKLPTLILVNKVTLGLQIQENLIKDGVDCGICSGKGVKKGYCMVSTIQSVGKIGDLSRYKSLVIDESHNASASTFQNFLSQYGCPLKYGFSASPFRNGDYLGYAKIRQFMGSPIVKVESKELIENKVMAKPYIYIIKNECKEDEYFDYQTAYSEEIVNSKKRNQIAVNICEKYGSGVLILVNLIEHGEILKEMIPGSEFIAGNTSIEDRMRHIKDFDEGRLPVLIASTILQEGISITHMKALILQASGKSNIAILQKLGRGLRFKAGEKEQVSYYDYYDTAKFLSKHSKMRINLYKKAGYNDIKLLDENLEEIKSIDKK